MDTDQDQRQIMAPCTRSLWTICVLLLALLASTSSLDPNNQPGVWTVDCDIKPDTPRLKNNAPNPKNATHNCRQYWTCAEDGSGNRSLKQRNDTVMAQISNFDDPKNRVAWCAMWCKCGFHEQAEQFMSTHRYMMSLLAANELRPHAMK